VQDTVLKNAWGVAFSPAGSPFWVNDNGTGCSTLYSGAGTKLALQVSIPLPGNVVPAASCHPVDATNPPNPAPATPTGIVWNPSSAFLVPGTKLPAVFIFATENGTVSAWAGGLNPADSAVIAVDNARLFGALEARTDEAAAALRSVQASGFTSAYTRQISR